MKDTSALDRLTCVIFQDFLSDPAVTDFHVQPPDRDGNCLRITRKRGVMTDHGTVLAGDVVNYLARLASWNGKEFGHHKPRLNARLPSGERLHANFPPITSGPCFSVRQPARGTVTLAMLVKWEMLTQEASDRLRGYIDAGMNILVSGAPGSGKTTLLRALCYEDAIREGRTILAQDPTEFTIPGKHALSMEADEDGEYPVTLGDCVSDSLRKDTETLVVGEVRTEQAAKYMVDGFNTVSRILATVHARSAKQAPMRVADLVKADKAGRRKIAEYIDVVVHVTRDYRTDRRWVEKIGTVDGYKKGEFAIS
jgi:type IV secretion system protein VirB11